MIRKGFIFNHELCVGCKACSAACMLENGWKLKARTIYSANADAFVNQPVVNLSMACNHCTDPLCLKGCPASAYYRDDASGAVLIDPGKCLGCRYCIWNCPYDAPKFSDKEGIIEKCTLCFGRIEAGYEPACSSSCPTGALDYGEIPEISNAGQLRWMPPVKINPSLHFTGQGINRGPEIIPAFERKDLAAYEEPEFKVPEIEWSLVAFSFLSTISVSLASSSAFTGSVSGKELTVLLILLAGLFSLFHLKARLKSWRSVINVFNSPLSREIVLYIIFTLLVSASLISGLPASSIVIPVTGLLFLLSIDAVYHFSPGQSHGRLHSGQTFLSGLLMISYFAGTIIPFLFMALIKLVLSLVSTAEKKRVLFSVRFIRIALLFIATMLMIKETSAGRQTALVIFLSGELIDRIIFYADFRPVNIKDTIEIS